MEKRQVESTPDQYIKAVREDLSLAFPSPDIDFKVRTPSTTDVERPYEVHLSVVDLQPMHTSPQAIYDYWTPMDLLCSAIIIEQPASRDALDRIDNINFAAALLSYLHMRTYQAGADADKILASPNRTESGGGYFPLTVAHGEQEGRTVLGFQIRWRASIMMAPRFEALGPPAPVEVQRPPVGAISGRGSVDKGTRQPSALLSAELLLAPISDQVWVENSEITPLRPHATVSAGDLPHSIEYSLEPDLPEGMNFNRTTGAIYGAPTETSDTTRYTLEVSCPLNMPRYRPATAYFTARGGCFMIAIL